MQATAYGVPAGSSIPPLSNTGGKITGHAPSVDWLSFTWDAESFPLVGVLETVAGWLSRPSEVVDAGHGYLGFSKRLNIGTRVESQSVSIGLAAIGGENQRGRALVALSGTGCALISPSTWGQVAGDLAAIGARLTRVDLALDDMAGVFGVDLAAEWYRAGDFGTGGNTPSCDQRGNWLTPDGRGRTLYVGQARNGKVLCCYEKGKQLGDVTSPWVRWEMRFGNKDRVIPYDILIRRSEFFAGGYSCLGRLLDAAAERIRTVRANVDAALGVLVMHAKRAYGKLVHVLLAEYEGDCGHVLEILRERGVPRRLAPGWVAAIGAGG